MGYASKFLLCRSATDNICRLRVHAVSFCLVQSAFCRLRLCHRKGSFFTARKRSLGQGNIFRSVCQELCPGGGGACMTGMVHGRGHAWLGECVWQGGMRGREVCMPRGCAWPGGMCGWGDMHGWGVCMAGGCAWPGGVHGQGGMCGMHVPHPWPDTTRCGRYASYWNAFLFWSENKATSLPDGFLENPI